MIYQANITNYYRIMFFLLFTSIIIFSSEVVFAGDDVIGDTLCKLVKNLSGGIARSIATIAIFAVGIGLFMGKINWGIGAATTSGVAIVFGAEKLAKWLAPADSNWENCGGA